MTKDLELTARLELDALLRDVRSARQALQGLDANLDIDLNLDTSAAERKVEGFAAKARSVLGSIGEGFLQGFGQGAFNAVLGGAQAAIGAVVNLGQSVIQVGSQFEQTEIAFTTFLGNADKAKALLEELTTFTATTPFELPEVQNTARQLLAMGVNAQEVLPTLKALGDVASGTSQPLGELAVIYGQVLNKGKLQTEELLQFAERGVPIVDTLAKNLGVSSKEIFKLTSEGKIGFNDLQQAFVSLTSEGGKFFNLMEAQSQSVGGKLSNLADNFTQSQKAIFDSIKPAVASVLDLLNEGLSEVSQSDVFGRLATEARAFGEEIKSNEELSQAFKEAISQAVDALGTTAIDAAKGLTEALKENPRLIADLIQGMSAFIQLLGRAIKLALDLANRLLAAGQELKVLQEGGATKVGSKRALKLVGGTKADELAIEKRVRQRIENRSALEKVGDLFRGVTGQGFAIDKIREQETINQIEKIAKNRIKSGQAERDSRRLADAAKPKATPKTTTPSLKPQASAPEDDPKAREKAQREREKAARKAEQDRKKRESEAARAAKEAERAREQAQAAALDKIRRANEQADFAIEQSAQKRTAAVKQLVLEGKLTEEQAASRLAQVEVDSTGKQLEAKKKKLAEVQKLRASGKIDAKKAADLEIELQRQIGQLNLARIDKELQAQRALRAEKIAALEEETKARTAPLQNRASEIGLNSSAIQSQADLLNAQLGLSNALFDLEQQRLQFALEDAKVRGDSLAVFRLQERLFKSQNDQLAAQQAAQTQLLALSQQEKLNQLEIQQIQAQIAQIEAQAAVQRAEIEGKSQAEIDRLRQVADLRKRVVDQTAQQIQNQQKINDLNQQEVAAQQRIAKERQARDQQQARQQAANPDSAGAGSSGGQGSLAPGGVAGAGSSGGVVAISGAALADYNAARQKFDQILSQTKSVGELQMEVVRALALTQGNQQKFLAQQAAAFGQGEVADKFLALQQKGVGSQQINAAISQARKTGQDLGSLFDRLLGEISRLANNPRALYVSAPDPIGSIGQISANLSKQMYGGARI